MRATHRFICPPIRPVTTAASRMMTTFPIFASSVPTVKGVGDRNPEAQIADRDEKRYRQAGQEGGNGGPR